MEGIILVLIIFVIIIAIIARLTGRTNKQVNSPWEQSTLEDISFHRNRKNSNYFNQFSYGRKNAVMTDRELQFFRRLENVSQGKYYIFPQMHLSAIMFNKTGGRYRRLAFQRINRSSIDFLLCDKETLSPVYAIELDDRTHDTELRRKRDAGIEAMFASVNMPLIRFRDVEHMLDDQIIEKLVAASNSSSR